MDPREKTWHQLLKATLDIELQRIVIVESNVLRPQTIDFSRVTALVGTHGSAKTTLLRMIDATFGWGSDVGQPPFVGRQSFGFEESTLEGILEVTLKTPFGAVTRTIDINGAPGERARIWREALGLNYEVEYISAPTALRGLEFLWQGHGHIIHPRSNVEHHKYTAGELRALRRILGRPYNQATVRKVMVDYNTKDSWERYEPFVVAQLGERVIDSAQMSLGEIWVHHIIGYVMQDDYWLNLVMLDEPESFLSQRGQRSFIDEVARLALAGGRQLIIATHSPEIFSRFPLTNVRLCTQSTDGVVVTIPQSAWQVKDSVGLQSPLRAIVVLEDENAVKVFRAICSVLSPGMDHDVDAVPAGGKNEVIAAVRTMRAVRRLSIFGVLDGDQRHEAADSKYAIYYLPGDECPEDELISAAAHRPAVVAASLSCSLESVLIALANCADLDHQYRIPRLASGLGQDERVVIHALVTAWLADGQIYAQAEQLLNAIGSE